MKKIITLVLLLFSILPFFAQTQKATYESNRLFVRLKSDINWQFPSIKVAENLPLLEKWSDLAEVGRQFGLQKIWNPFQTKSEKLDRTYSITFSKTEDISLFIKALQALPYFELVEKVPIYSVDYLPNDYSPTAEYYLAKINAPTAWDLVKGDTNVVIAVIDVAVMSQHEDLAANMFINWKEPIDNVDNDGNGYIDDRYGWDAADNDNDANPPTVSFSHGTHVAGCASAVTDNNKGIASIGYKCRILPIKAKSTGTTGASLNATFEGVDYAVACGYADVVNMSFGGSGYSGTYQALLDAGYNKGITFVASAGNDGNNQQNYPCTYNHVICVGATNENDIKSWFSNFGTQVDVSAPGSNILSTIPGGLTPPVSNYASWDGTSMSSPIVAGIVAAMKAANPSLTPDLAETCLETTAFNLDALNPNYVGLLGAGRVNAQAAISCATPSVAPAANYSIVNTSVCGGKIEFKDLSQNVPTTWSWNFGNGQTSSSYHPIITFSQSGTYSISLTVTNPFGTNTYTQNVQINVLPIPVVDAGTNISLCYGQTANLSATSNLTGTITWAPSLGISNVNILNPQLTTTQSRAYTISVATTDGCVGTDSLNVTVNPNPTVWAGSDVTIQPGNSTNLNPIASGSGTLTYLWSPSTGLSDPNIKTPVASPTNTQLYTLTVTTQNNCSKFDAVLVTVAGTTSLSLPNGEMSILEPLPNPAHTTTVLSANITTPSEELSIKVYNANGQFVETLFSGKVKSEKFEMSWNKAHLAAGLYFVVWEMKGEKLTQKVIWE
jgi:subtilisin family serine protease